MTRHPRIGYNTGMETHRFDQTYFVARNAQGATQDFFFGCYTPEDTAKQNAIAFAGKNGEVTLVGRRRLNDYVGSPVWSHATPIAKI